MRLIRLSRFESVHYPHAFYSCPAHNSVIQMDYGTIIEQGLLKWWKNPALVKLFVGVFIVYFLFSALVILASVGTFGIDLAIAMQQKSGAVDSDWVSQIDPAQFIGAMLLYIGIVFVLAIVMAIGLSILGAFIGSTTMSNYRLAVKKVDTGTGLRFLLLGIYNCLVVLFLIKDIKWLVVPIASVLLIVVGILTAPIGLLLTLIGVLGFVIYFLVLIYHSIRLSFSGIYWLSSEKPMGQAIDESWNFTKGKVIDIFIATLVGTVAVSIVVFVIAEVLAIIVVLLAGTAGSTLITLIGILVATLFRSLAQAFLIVASWTILVEIFTQLQREHPNPSN